MVSISDAIAAALREERSAVVAALVRALGDVHLAEGLLQEALVVALALLPMSWPPVIALNRAIAVR